MDRVVPPIPNLIIGGTTKAGTTAVFNYLSGHPQVCASRKKETWFCVAGYTGDVQRDRRLAASYFPRGAESAAIRVEATAGFLADAFRVVPRLRKILLDPRFLFLLRSPPERLHSYYNLQVSKFTVPREVSFADFVAMALRYANGEPVPEAEFDSVHLEALRHGNYGGFLQVYLDAFPRERIAVEFYESLRADPAALMRRLCRFLQISAAYYDDYAFQRKNATYWARSDRLHRAAIGVNDKLERVLRRYPRAKHFLAAVYRRLNTASEGYEPMAADVRRVLLDYYAPDMRRVEELLGRELPPNWRAR